MSARVYATAARDDDVSRCRDRPDAFREYQDVDGGIRGAFVSAAAGSFIREHTPRSCLCTICHGTAAGAGERAWALRREYHGGASSQRTDNRQSQGDRGRDSARNCAAHAAPRSTGSDQSEDERSDEESESEQDKRVLIGKAGDRRRISRKARRAWLLSGNDQDTLGDEAPMYGQGARVAMVKVLNADETDELNAARRSATWRIASSRSTGRTRRPT